MFLEVKMSNANATFRTNKSESTTIEQGSNCKRTGRASFYKNNSSWWRCLDYHFQENNLNYRRPSPISGGVETACGNAHLIQVLSTAQQTKSVYGFVFFEELKQGLELRVETLLLPMWLHMGHHVQTLLGHLIKWDKCRKVKVRLKPINYLWR
jgi:predicted metalloprotease